MRIKKIPGQYPATIAAAVKDANFRKADNTVMTQSEINKSFSDLLDSVSVDDRGHLILGS